MRKSDEKFRSVVEGTKAYINIIDLKGTVLYSNNILEVYDINTYIGSNLYDWMEDQLDEMGKKSLYFMRQATQKMSTLITGLMEYSQLNQVRHKVEVDSKVLLQSVLSDLSATIKETRAEITVGEMPKLYTYGPDIYLVFLNLVSNAIKFHKPNVNPIVKIKAVKKKSDWEFSIQDNGMGINPEYHGQIFGIYQRLHHQDVYEGTGIGLAYCKKIVESYGGKIWLESSQEDGSIFYFTVPH